MLYESAFVEALNSKRSSCEQAGKKIVVSFLLGMDNVDDFFTMEELCKLRLAKTIREKEAFCWFFGVFLECVCGARVWGVLKFSELVSHARQKGTNMKAVTVSDEAFALLLLENYRTKWFAQARKEKKMIESEESENDRKMPARRDHNRNVATKARDEENEEEEEAEGTRVTRGLYTGVKTGKCKFGGWSREGMKRFNELYNLAWNNRCIPDAAEMEENLLAYIKSHKQGDEDRNNVGSPAEGSALPENLEPPVETFWDDELEH